MFYVSDSEVNKKKVANLEQNTQVVKQIDDYREFNIIKNWQQINKQNQIITNNKVIL